MGPVLTTRDRGARLGFAIEYQNWQVCPWHFVLFTKKDESRFTLSTCDRHERVWKSWGPYTRMFSIFWVIYRNCDDLSCHLAICPAEVTVGPL